MVKRIVVGVDGSPGSGPGRCGGRSVSPGTRRPRSSPSTPWARWRTWPAGQATPWRRVSAFRPRRQARGGLGCDGRWSTTGVPRLRLRIAVQGAPRAGVSPHGAHGGGRPRGCRPHRRRSSWSRKLRGSCAGRRELQGEPSGASAGGHRASRSSVTCRPPPRVEQLWEQALRRSFGRPACHTSAAVPAPPVGASTRPRVLPCCQSWRELAQAVGTIGARPNRIFPSGTDDTPV